MRSRRPTFVATGLKGANQRPWRPLDELFDGMLSGAAWKSREWFDLEEEDDLAQLGRVHHEVPGEWEDQVWLEVLWRRSPEAQRPTDWDEYDGHAVFVRHLPAVPGRCVRG